MSFLKQIQEKIPEYTQEDYNQYLFWRNNLEYVDEMLMKLQREAIVAKSANESTASAIKRLGTYEFLVGIKANVRTTEAFVKTLKEDTHE